MNRSPQLLLPIIAPLLIAAHAPTGNGLPKPGDVYALSPFQLEIRFEEPLTPPQADAFVGSRITFPGDRGTSRAKHDASLHIVAARRCDDGRRLELITDPHPVLGPYSLRIPSLDFNLAYNLHGVALAWDSGPDPNGVHPAPVWNGWWPSLQSQPAMDAMQRLQDGESLQTLLAKPGSLHILTRLKVDQSPARITLKTPLPLTDALCAGEPAELPPPPGQPIAWLYQGDPGLIDLELRIPTGNLLASSLGGNDNPLPLALEIAPDQENAPSLAPGPDRFVLPWVPDPLPPPPHDDQAIPDLAGGDPAKGREVFTSSTANCLACHRLGNQGAEIGPDLSLIADRDPAWIYRQIANPSAEISPVYRPYTVVLRSGRVLAGLVRARDAGTIRVINQAAGEELVPRADIAELRPSATSIMPVGLAPAIGVANLRHLIAFLKQPRNTD